MEKLLIVFATVLSLSIPAQAGDLRIFDSQENLSMNYTLPSWAENGHCKKILSIDKYGFAFEDKSYCEPLKIQSSKGVAPSGTVYFVTITARCQAATMRIEQLFKFTRYKGNLTVATK